MNTKEIEKRAKKQIKHIQKVRKQAQKRKDQRAK